MINKGTKLSLTHVVVTLCFLAFSLSLVHAADVTLTVGDGSGSPGSSENPITVSLENPNDEIRGIQVDICDVDNYLSCTSCEITEHTSGFSCLTNEIDDCCKVLLVPLSGGSIGKGTGSIFTVKYDVSSSAPGGECRELNPENVSVVSVSEVALDVTAQSGEFCFASAAPTTTTVRECPCLIKEIYSENAEEVTFLRNFRDEVLSKTPSGRELIRLYYQWWGPAVVKAIEEDTIFRKKIKVIIDKAIPLIKGETE